MISVSPPAIPWSRPLLTQNRWLWVSSLLMFGLFGILLGLWAVDNRQVMGINVWIKPIKFSISSGLYFLTMAWLLTFSDLSRRANNRLSAVMALSMLIEMIIVVGQAARGERSHFNFTSLLGTLLFAVMGWFILINALANGFLVWRFFWQRTLPNRSPALLWSIRLGLLIFWLATLVGGFMLTQHGHVIGAAENGPGLPLLNWSTTGGDLRIAHFAGQHALQLLPLTTLLLLRRWPRLPVRVVWIVAGSYFLVCLALLLQALARIPFWRI